MTHSDQRVDPFGQGVLSAGEGARRSADRIDPTTSAESDDHAWSAA